MENNYIPLLITIYVEQQHVTIRTDWKAFLKLNSEDISDAMWNNATIDAKWLPSCYLGSLQYKDNQNRLSASDDNIKDDMSDFNKLGRYMNADIQTSAIKMAHDFFYAIESKDIEAARRMAKELDKFGFKDAIEPDFLDTMEWTRDDPYPKPEYGVA